MRFDQDFKFPKAGAMRKKTSLSARYNANFPDDKSMSYKKVVPDRGHPTMKTGLFVTSLRLVYMHIVMIVFHARILSRRTRRQKRLLWCWESMALPPMCAAARKS